MKIRKFSLILAGAALALVSASESARADETPDGEAQSRSLGQICDLLCPAGTRGDVVELAHDASASPRDITAGADGRVWYTDSNSNRILASTPSGVVTAYPLPSSNAGGEITLSLTDHRLWFTASRAVGAVTSGGAFTIYPLPGNGSPTALAYGPDGNIWYTKASANVVGKITPAGVVTEFALSGGSQPHGVTAGLDGNVWVAEFASNKIARVTTTGTVTEYALPAHTRPDGITLGPDGNLWVAALGAVARVTTAGVITEFALSDPFELPASITSDVSVFGLCGDSGLWFAESSDKVATITTSGAITEFPLTAGTEPSGITLVPWADDCGFLNLWFTEASGQRLGKIRAFTTH